MMKRLAFIVLLSFVAEAQIDYVNMVCFSDSSGRCIRIWGPDSAKVVKDVILVTLNGVGYTVTTKNKITTVFPKPIWVRIEPTSEEVLDKDKTSKKTVVADEPSGDSKINEDKSKDDDKKSKKRR